MLHRISKADPRLNEIFAHHHAENGCSLEMGIVIVTILRATNKPFREMQPRVQTRTRSNRGDNQSISEGVSEYVTGHGGLPGLSSYARNCVWVVKTEVRPCITGHAVCV